MRRILVIRFGALGDLVLATALLPLLRHAHPGARITWVTKGRWGDLLRSDPRIDDLVLLGDGESVNELRGRLEPTDFDLVVDAHANLRSHALCALLPPAPLRRLRKDGFARWLRLRGGPVLPALRRRLVDRFAELVPESADVAPRPRIQVGTSALDFASSFLGAANDGDRGWVALAPGAQHAAKRWPSERFAAVGRRAVEAGFAVLVIGGPGEQDTLDAVVAAVPGALHWPAERALDELAAVLAGCTVTVGNDTGLLHLSEAMGTPVVAIFGPTVREWGYFPLDPRSRVLEKDVACRPCSRMGERPCHQPEPWCLTRTSVDEVAEATFAVALRTGATS